MTKEEFIAAYCLRSGIKWEWLSEFRHVVPCDCGCGTCEGWAMVPLEFETHNGLPLQGIKTWGGGERMSEPWRNRIVGHADVSPAELLDHPANWREHGPGQAKAVAGALGELGWVQSVIVNQRTMTILDGHLRVGLARDLKHATVPVVFVELTDEEERIVLATLDPLRALAAVEVDTLRLLLEQVDTGNDDLAALLERMAPAPLPDFSRDTGPSQEEFVAAEAAAATHYSELAGRRAGRLVEIHCPECGKPFSVDPDDSSSAAT